MIGAQLIKCSKFLYHVGSYYEGVKVYNFDGDGVCKLFCIECWKKITIDHQDTEVKKLIKKKKKGAESTTFHESTPNEKRRQAIVSSLHKNLRAKYLEEFK